MEKRTDNILFVLLCIICLAPILTAKYVPSVDLPNHILSAVLHADALDSNYLSAEWVISPYILFFVLMYPFVKLFGYLVASKIVLGLYVISLPLSVRWFIGEFNPENRILAFLSFPFIYTYHFDYGFIPYVVGIPLVFLGLAALNRCLRTGLPIRLIMLASILSLLIYLSHFMNFAAFAVGVLFLFRRNRDALFGGENRTGTSTLKNGMKLSLVFAPSLLLLVFYVADMIHGGEFVAKSWTMASYESAYHQLAGAVRFFLTKNMLVDALRVGLLGLLFLCFLFTREKIINRGFLLYFGIATLALSVLLPRHYFFGGSDLSSRMALFGAVSVIGSITVRKVISRRIVLAVALILTSITMVYHTAHTRFIDQLTESYVEALSSCIPSGSRICTIHNAFLEDNVPYMAHAIAYHHLEHGGFSPFLFTDQPQVAGIASSITLPRLSETWNPEDTLRFEEVLPHYDYLVINTYGSELPQSFMAMSDGFVHSDSVCTVIDLSKTVYSGHDRDQVS